MSATEVILQQASTPYPAWTMLTALVGTWFATPTPPPAPAGSGWRGYRQVARLQTKPTSLSCIGFGWTYALGGYMVADGAVDEGAGFNTAWLALYLLVNGGASVKQVVTQFRVWPLVLTGLAGGNLAIYGHKFLMG